MNPPDCVFNVSYLSRIIIPIIFISNDREVGLHCIMLLLVAIKILSPCWLDYGADIYATSQLAARGGQEEIVFLFLYRYCHLFGIDFPNQVKKLFLLLWFGVSVVSPNRMAKRS